MPLEMVGKVLPPARYVRFVHKGRAKEMWMTLDFIYQTRLPKSGNLVAAPFELYLYGDDYGGPDSPDSETEVLIPIEQKQL
jgi:AraC family transcriptional regulator